MIRTAFWFAAFTVVCLSACKKAPVADDVCKYDPVPATANVPSGQGGIMTRANTDTYFFALDDAGKQIGSAHVNAVLTLKPGDYRVKLNNSVHAASVRSGTLAACSAGEVLTSGKTDEYYYVLDGAGTQLASAHLSAALSLFPGDYQVRLNNSRSAAKVQAGATATLSPGTVNMEASTDEYYYVFDSAGTQLASSHVGRPLALFPGTYNIKLNNTVAPANLVAGNALIIRAGSVTLEGPTDEYYYIFDHAGTQLAAAHLGRPLSLVAGDYTAKLNNVSTPVRAEEGKANEYPTGTLTVKASGSDYYYVFDSAGTQLASSQVNRPVSLPAGNYSVKLGNNTHPAVVTPGQALVINL